MNRLIIIFAISALWALSSAFGQDASTKIAIIKADDIRDITVKWNRFFAISKEKGVKVSAGVICESLEGEKKEYFDWLRDLEISGWVELWNHGWDHKRMATKDDLKRSEFRGSGYEHQKAHFENSQQIMERVLGVRPIAFGTPFNAVDADTVRVMNEDRELRLFFAYSVSGLSDKVIAQMSLRGEHDGTGKPYFEKFKAGYGEKKDLSFSAIQFHPNHFEEEHFSEYAKIIDFLVLEGWTFMLPVEYVSSLPKS